VTPLGLPRAVLDAIYAHAEKGHPEEVCGLVFAKRGVGYPDAEARPCENRERRCARTGYDFAPRDLMLLDESLRSERPARIIYHSHVEVGAYFSDEDVHAAAPAGALLYPCDHLVVDVKHAGAQGCRLFRFERDRFVEIGHEARVRP
jgi:adenylyltransferase/sulfurtransferase